MKKEFIISFDISNEKRLKKISKYLEQKSLRIQLSVFYTKCTKNEIKNIINSLKKLMDSEDDDIRIYQIDSKNSIFLKNGIDIRKLII